jgi:hypothetical protein
MRATAGAHKAGHVPFRVKASLWVKAHKVLAVLIALAAALPPLAAAAILYRQTVSVAPSTMASDVTFLDGDDLTAMEALGYIDATVSSASITVANIEGIPGAEVEYTDVFEIDNSHATRDYSIVLVRSGALDTDFSLFEVTIRDPSSGAFVWDALADVDGESPAFTLEDDGTAGDRLEVDITVGVDNGVATTGSVLDAFSLSLEITAV